ncbi:MAG: serine/threonine protein kinase [Myxococcales bacterium]|nr:MAG: serine/threonine protein kinase [Myxococcales bacterium]
MGLAARNTTPKRIGRYELLFPIGSGGMAEVYAARIVGEAGFQKLVALKRMHGGMTGNEDNVTMFLDEARIAADISSPHVVSTLDLGRAEDGTLFIVMELVVGVPLSSINKTLSGAENGPRPIGMLCEILSQAAKGLHDAHEAKTPTGTPLGIVHRDISPHNILVGVDGRVKLTDFGVARAAMRNTQTSTGQFKGKFAYFSPEQARGEDLDRRSDIFALGIVTWEALSGERLFKTEKESNPLNILERILWQDIRPLHEFRMDVPKEISDVVSKALQRDKLDRWQTAAEFGLALEKAIRDSYSRSETSGLSDFVREAGAVHLSLMQENIRRALQRSRSQESNKPDSTRDPERTETALTHFETSHTRSISLSSPFKRYAPWVVFMVAVAFIAFISARLGSQGSAAPAQQSVPTSSPSIAQPENSAANAANTETTKQPLDEKLKCSKRIRFLEKQLKQSRQTTKQRQHHLLEVKAVASDDDENEQQLAKR